MQNMQGIRAIDSLDEATSIIKNEMESMFDGFIAIGFYLKKIRDDRLYLQKGYSSIFDYSDQAFKLTRFQTTRFMEVNDVYSIGGYSPEIDDKWKGYGSSKLVEMMALPEEIREMVPQQATVREIRDAKKVVRETKDKYSPQMNLCDAAQEPDENWMKLLAKMLGKDRSIFMTMIEWERSDIGNDRTGIEKEVQTLVNPSGFQVLRFETANIWMTENCIRVNPYKVNGEVPNSVEYTYIDLAMAFEEIYYPNYPDISEAAQKIYERVYGEALWQAEENDMCDVAQDEAIEEKHGTAIDELNLSVRTYNVLKRAGVETIEELQSMSDVDLAMIRNFSRRCMDEVHSKLEEYARNNAEKTACDVAHESEEQIPGQMNVEDYPEILPEQSDNDINNDEDNVVDAEYREVIEENTVDTDEPEKIKPAQPDLPVLKNNDQRKEWLKDYKSWGLWYRDENIDVNYYKYDFSDGSRLIVDEYPQRRMYWNYKEFTDEHYYHLLEKNRKYYGSDKTFEHQYVHSTESETYLVEFLKNLQKKETKKHV
ncbi:DNA-directed RNA polymerase subunit alpha C-terminal domain-containing protein [Bariatricus sp. SGI.161]|uniref:DNA-directed RNA polymerase subunit alpha C-terminal domain-containing protein n=1 Tax=Bariatricus sp. SGI.161 TaxID=3420550 RepID=UPI003CFFC2CB